MASPEFERVRLYFTDPEPCRHADDQDPEEVKEWLEETYPDIERRPEGVEAEILGTDECGVDADHHPGTGYARKGQRATMEVPHSHVRRSVISAVGNHGGCHFMTYSGTLSAALFVVPLEGLLTETTGKAYSHYRPPQRPRL